MNQQQLRITALGGLDQTGALNSLVYETESSAIIVDCGLGFVDLTEPAIDYKIPNFDWLNEIKPKLKAVILTHGHEDHMGALAFLLKQFDLPVYSDPFTLNFAKKRLDEFGVTAQTKAIEKEATYDFDDLQFSFYPVDHSIPRAYCLAISFRGQTLVHLTDWKIDPTTALSQPSLKKIKKNHPSILAVFSDSTNIHNNGATLSEAEVTKNLHKLIKGTKSRVIVSLFSSHLKRVEALFDIAQKAGRTVYMAGRSLKENFKIAQKVKVIDPLLELHDVDEIKNQPDEQILLLASGSQGESRSVMHHLSLGRFGPFQIKEKDRILFSARVIPGHEVIFTHLCDRLLGFGAEVFTPRDVAIHTSGHAAKEEIIWALKKLKPKYIVPIHGHLAHRMAHRDLALKLGYSANSVKMFRNSQSLLIDDNQITVLDSEKKNPPYFLQGSHLIYANDPIFKQRKKLASGGIVILQLNFLETLAGFFSGEEKNKDLLNFEWNHYGALAKNQIDLLSNLEKDLFDLIQNWQGPSKADLHDKIYKAVRLFFKKNLQTKPYVEVFLGIKE